MLLNFLYVPSFTILGTDNLCSRPDLRRPLFLTQDRSDGEKENRRRSTRSSIHRGARVPRAWSVSREQKRHGSRNFGAGMGSPLGAIRSTDSILICAESRFPGFTRLFHKFAGTFTLRILVYTRIWKVYMRAEPVSCSYWSSITCRISLPCSKGFKRYKPILLTGISSVPSFRGFGRHHPSPLIILG